jgi:hypothetical protein
MCKDCEKQWDVGIDLCRKCDKYYCSHCGIDIDEDVKIVDEVDEDGQIIIINECEEYEEGGEPYYYTNNHQCELKKLDIYNADGCYCNICLNKIKN